VNRSLPPALCDLNIEFRMPTLEKDFTSSPLGDFRHTVEPFVLYRRIHGIRELDKTIRLMTKMR